MGELTHFDEHGDARMVDVGNKPPTNRVAVARGVVSLAPETMRRVLDRTVKKGDVLSVAQLAGIMGAKQTPNLIPLCHPLSLTSISVHLTPFPERNAIEILATVKTRDRTGVEMEALTAVSVAALTLYDMCKAIDRTMTIERIELLEKHGGKSGSFVRENTRRE